MEETEGDAISTLFIEPQMDKINEEEEGNFNLLRSRSERVTNKPIMKEIEEYLYNTHIDEYNRQQEINEWNPKKKELYNGLDKLIDYHVTEIINYIFKEKELREIFLNGTSEENQQVWKDRFVEYTIKAIRLVKPSERLMKDTMNINDYVTIELIDHENDSKCKYING